MSDSNEYKPVFVVGMNGSGTTMLADCLGHHPDLYMLPHETYVLPYYIKEASRFGDLQYLENRQSLANAIVQHKAYWAINDGKKVELPDEFLTGYGLASVIDGIYRYFSQPQGKTRWCDKTPMYIQHMRTLSTVFPQAKFIHIYRDGRDVAQSMHRRWRLKPERTIYRWRRTIEAARAEAAGLPDNHYFEVAYEQVTNEPEASLAAICDFLDLPFDPKVLVSSMPFMDNKGEAESKQIVKNSGKWAEYFSAAEATRLEDIAGITLHSLGYNVANPNGSVNPTRTKLTLWLLRDKINSTIQEFKMYGPKYILVLYKRIKDSLIQNKMNRY